MRWRSDIVKGLRTGGRGAEITEADKKVFKWQDIINSQDSRFIMTDFECEVYESEVEKKLKESERLEREQRIQYEKDKKAELEAMIAERKKAGLSPISPEVKEGDK
jgi:hypothetical protein